MKSSIVYALLAACAAGIFMVSPASAQETGFYASADWLEWKARRRDMDFVIVDPNTDARVEGEQKNVNYNRNSGARVALGYHLDSLWDCSLTYQTYGTNGRLLVNQPNGGSLWGTRLHPDSIIGDRFSTSAEGSASLDYDVLDFMLSRRFTMDRSQQVDFTLFGGFRYAMIDQTLGINYIDANNVRSAVISDTIKLDGYGIRAGGNLQWNVFGGFSVFGQGALSVLAARSNAHYVETDYGTTTYDMVNVTETYYQAVPVIETALGVAYRRGGWEVAGGYEMALWGNVGERRDFGDDVDEQKFSNSSSDLLLDGFFLRLAYNY